MASILMAQEYTRDIERAAKELRPHGHSVTVVSSAAEAMDRIHASIPNVLVIHDLLKGGFGRDVVRVLRSLPGGERTRVVALTMPDSDGVPVRMIEDVDARIMVLGGFWQIVLTVEAFVGSHYEPDCYSR
ncbi:MAG TPA: hypothetical protein VGM37_07160 [Armatimonadota bacterium]